MSKKNSESFGNSNNNLSRKYFFLNHSGGFTYNPLIENNIQIGKKIQEKKINPLAKFFQGPVAKIKQFENFVRCQNSSERSHPQKRKFIKISEGSGNSIILRNIQKNIDYSSLHEGRSLKNKKILKESQSNEYLKILLSINKSDDFLKNYPSSEKTLLADIDPEIKKNMPEAFTNAVGTRLNAKKISNLLQIKKDSNELNTQIIHTLFWEIQRQILIDCQERGKALANIWIERNNLEKEFLHQQEEYKYNEENKNYNECQRINSLCNKIIESEKDKVRILEETIITLNSKLKLVSNELEGKEEICKMMTKKINESNTINNYLQKKLKEKIDENNFLILRCGLKNNNISNLNNCSSQESISEKSSDGRISMIDDVEQKVENLNLVELTYLPEKSREERLKDQITEIESDHWKFWFKSSSTQSELSLISPVYDYLLSEEGKIKEIAQEHEIRDKINGIVLSNEINDTIREDINYSGRSSVSRVILNKSNKIADSVNASIDENHEIIFRKANSNDFEGFDDMSNSPYMINSLASNREIKEFADKSFNNDSMTKSIHTKLALMRTQDIIEKRKETLLMKTLSQNNLSLEDFMNILTYYQQEKEKSKENSEIIKNLVKSLENEKELLKFKLDEIFVLKEENSSFIEEINELKKMLKNYKEYEAMIEVHKKQKSQKSQEFINSNDFVESDDPVIKRRTTRMLSNRLKSLGSKLEIEKRKNIGRQIIDKLKHRKISNFRNFMHIKIIMKTIFSIYAEKISMFKENNSNKEIDFGNFCYSYFLKLFGFKKITEERFVIFILSLKKNISYLRINIFARFMGILDSPINYSIEEFNKYIEALDFILNQSQLGVSIGFNELESKYYVPYIRALQYTGMFGDKRMTVEENSDIKRDIESMKESDPKGVNKAGIIDFDIYMEKVLSKYRILVNRAKIYVINAFAASDLDGNGMCNMEEFLLLNKHIEAERYDEDELKSIFLDNADLENEGEKNLSFDKFSVVCVEYNLFTDEQQNKYLEIETKKDLWRKFEDILRNWESIKLEILSRFDNISGVGDQEIDNWKTITTVLEKKLKERPNEIKPLLIAFKILDNESLAISEMQKTRIASNLNPVDLLNDDDDEISQSSLSELDEESNSSYFE